MDKVDILYVIGTGSQNNNAELLYSLRSVSKYCKNVGRVVISGDIPSFVGGAAETVPCHDVEVFGKHWNMLYKISQGIRRANLTKPFLFSCDDHFFTRPTDLTQWRQRLRCDHIYTEKEWEEEHQHMCGKYQRAIAATGELLRGQGLPAINTVWHGNMWIDPKYLDDVIALAESHRRASVYGFEPMMIFESFMHRDGVDGPLVPLVRDVKASSFELAQSYASAYGCFSTSDKAWVNGLLKKWLAKMFPEKSEYEK